MTRGYTLQRWMNACAGRGRYPIKFNGTIFTVDGGGFDADSRQWGGPYWWQNTRLPYWPMLACGDFDMMQPLFRMYRDALPPRKCATRVYYNHAGAFYPETMYFWGTYVDNNYGRNRKNKPHGLTDNRYIRRYWQGGIDLTMMMLDYFDLTQDIQFAKAIMMPLVTEITTFFDRHWKRDETGKIRFHPAQSNETWWEATNPMPEIAGLRAVLPRLIALPEDLTTKQQRAAWQKTLNDLPALPMRAEGQTKYLLPAESFANRHNIENPELYAVFPYRLFGLGKPDLEVGRLTYHRRRHKTGGKGHDSDDFQAAYLGLTAGDADAMREEENTALARLAERLGCGLQAARTVPHHRRGHRPRRKTR